MSNIFINSEDDYEKIDMLEFTGIEGDEHTIESDDEKISCVGKKNKEIKLTIREDRNTQTDGEIDYIYKGLEMIGNDLKDAVGDLKKVMTDLKDGIKKGFDIFLIYLNTFDTYIEKEIEEVQIV